MDDILGHGKIEPEPCRYCGKLSCWIKSFGQRYDGAELIATCPKGKVLDRASEVIAEAEYNVAERNRKS